MNKMRFKDYINSAQPDLIKLEDILAESKIIGTNGADAKKLTVKLWGKGVFSKESLGSENTKYYKRCSGQIIYSKLDFLNGAFGIVPPDLDGYESTIDLPAFDISENIDVRYLLEIIKRPAFYLKVGALADGSRVARRVNPNIFLSSHVFLPSLPEQEKIANFLSVLDDRIDLQENRISLLKQQKKGYVQRIFNRDLRFQDDNGNEYPEWEETTLGSVIVLKNGYSFSSKNYKNKGAYKVITIKNVSGREVSTKNVDYVDSSEKLVPHQILKINDLLISLTGNVGRVSIVKEENLLLNQRVGLLEIRNIRTINSEFLYQLCASYIFLQRMIDAGQGAAQMNISKKDVENYLFGLPQMAEQEKIANFLSLLDNQIDLEKEKLAQYKLQKQGYMQRIFG